MSDKRFYTYVWFTGNRPIYVGKGTGDRYMQHAEKAWFHAYDVEPRLFAGLTEDEALALEATLIERFGLDNLANRDKGSTLRCDLVGEQESFASSMEPEWFNLDDVTQRMRRMREEAAREAAREEAQKAARVAAPQERLGTIWFPGEVLAKALVICLVLLVLSLPFLASMPALLGPPGVDGQISMLVEYETGHPVTSVVRGGRLGVDGYEAI